WSNFNHGVEFSPRRFLSPIAFVRQVLCFDVAITYLGHPGDWQASCTSGGCGARKTKNFRSQRNDNREEESDQRAQDYDEGQCREGRYYRECNSDQPSPGAAGPQEPWFEGCGL